MDTERGQVDRHTVGVILLMTIDHLSAHVIEIDFRGEQCIFLVVIHLYVDDTLFVGRVRIGIDK